ncbi:MAG: hypothetical protein ACPGU1_10705 [Myxococcota bacterium]
MRLTFQSPALFMCAAGFLLLSSGCSPSDSNGSGSDAVLDVDPGSDIEANATDDTSSDGGVPGDASADAAVTADVGPADTAAPDSTDDDAGSPGDDASDSEVSAEDVDPGDAQVDDATEDVATPEDTSTPDEDTDAEDDVSVSEDVASPEVECESDSDCDAEVSCATQTCDLATGTCQSAPHADGTPCDDGTVCSEADTCQGGVCLGGVALVCDDGNVCTDDICDPSTGCVYAFNLGGCDDDDPCTSNDLCTGGVCTGSASACDDGNPCTLDHCLPGSGECIHTDDDTLPCSDGSECTGGDQCTSGACVPGEVDACDDGNDCTSDSCEEGLCKNFPLEDQPCDDGEICTAGDTCLLAVCVPGQPDECDDDNPCTVDSCVFGSGCVHEVTPDVECDDGDVCTEDGVCDTEGACVPAVVEDCDDDNPCTVDNCHPENGCVYALKAGACDDGNPCTAGDFCIGGQCKGQPATCNDDDACTHDSCDDVLGCQFVSIASTCADEDECTDDSCDPESGCVFVPNTAACDDGLLCTELDACAEGVCTGQPVVCTEDDQCAAAICDPESGCVSVITPGTDCDDGDVCTAGTTCADDGSCAGGEPTDVDDGVGCTLDACTEADGVVHIPDDDVCQTGRHCDPESGCVLDGGVLLINKFAWTAGEGLNWIALVNHGDEVIDLLGLTLVDEAGVSAPLVAASGDPTAPILIAPGATFAAIPSPAALPDEATEGFSLLLGSPEAQPEPLLFEPGLLSLLDEKGEIVDTLNISSVVGSGTIGSSDFPMHPGSACEFDATASAVADEETDNDPAGLWCSWPAGASAPEGPQLPCSRARLNELALAGADGARWIELHMPAGGYLEVLSVRIVGADGELLGEVDSLQGRTPMSTVVLMMDGVDGVVLPQVTEGAVQLVRTGSIVDVCGFGALNVTEDATLGLAMVEGDPAEALVDTHVLQRSPDGADSDDNALDWFAAEDGTPGELNDVVP